MSGNDTIGQIFDWGPNCLIDFDWFVHWFCRFVKWIVAFCRRAGGGAVAGASGGTADGGRLHFSIPPPFVMTLTPFFYCVKCKHYIWSKLIHIDPQSLPTAAISIPTHIPKSRQHYPNVPWSFWNHSTFADNLFLPYYVRTLQALQPQDTQPKCTLRICCTFSKHRSSCTHTYTCPVCTLCTVCSIYIPVLNQVFNHVRTAVLLCCSIGVHACWYEYLYACM